MYRLILLFFLAFGYIIELGNNNNRRRTTEERRRMNEIIETER